MISTITLFLLLACLVQSSLNDKNNKDINKVAKYTEPFRIELLQKFDSQSEFKPRGIITVNPRTEYHAGNAEISQNELTQEDLRVLKRAHENNELYYLKTIQHTAKGESRSTQTAMNACSIYMSNLVDFIDINLSRLNEFTSVNMYTTNPECSPSLFSGDGTRDVDITRKFNTTLKIVHSIAGPFPDAATYIKRVEEERSSKLRDDKVDNRSFFGKYWIYIAAAILILLTFGGSSQEQAARW